MGQDSSLKTVYKGRRVLHERHLLQGVQGRKRFLTAAHFEGSLVHNCVDNDHNDTHTSITILFDTGALCANYCSEKFYHTISHLLKEEDIMPIQTSIGLADNRTVLDSDTTLKLKVEIIGRDRIPVSYHGEFVVIPDRKSVV